MSICIYGTNPFIIASKVCKVDGFPNYILLSQVRVAVGNANKKHTQSAKAATPL